MVTFGGSGSLLACRLMDILDLTAVLVPPNPGNVSAYGLLTVDVRNDYVRTAVAADAGLPIETLAEIYRQLGEQAQEALLGEGFAVDAQIVELSADLRYLGQAFEVRVGCPGVGDRDRFDRDRIDRDWADAVVETFHDAHRALYGYDFRGKADQRVEWVNLRVTGVGPIPRPVIAEIADGPGDRMPHAVSRSVHFGGWTEAAIIDRPQLGAGDIVTGPAIIQEFGSTVPVASRVPGHGRSVRQPDHHQGGRVMTADPILLEIVSGTLASVEAEVETAIGRTARSPMIRDAHDFRAGIHDARMRKLTGRSYSALVQPVVRDFPIEAMRPGDVYFHNDVYLSEGGIGHLPDLCVTVPVFHDGEVVAFVQAFGHHDDIGGTVPGSMPSHATSVFEEGLMVPPIKLWAAGVPNEAALTIMTRNSRMPESLGGRPGRGMLGVSDGRPAVGRTLRSVRQGGDRRRVRPHSRGDHDDLPHRAAVQDSGR